MVSAITFYTVLKRKKTQSTSYCFSECHPSIQGGHDKIELYGPLSKQTAIDDLPQPYHSYSPLTSAVATVVKAEWDSQMLAHLHAGKKTIKLQILMLVKYTVSQSNEQGIRSTTGKIKT